MQGANHHQWKGGVCSKDYLERRRFKHTMQALVFARDNYTCQICDQYGNSIQVDHIKPWSKYPDLRFELDNCRTLCMACHYYVTFKRKLPQGVVWGHNFNRRVAP
jgi:5-methylcytosine-specific restriction endonuclease McrA